MARKRSQSRTADFAELARLPRLDPRRLEIIARTPSGRGKLYADRITGERFTQRDIQTARNAGFRPEHVAAIRKAGLYSEIQREKQRAVTREVAPDVPAARIRALAESFGRKEGKKLAAAISSREFWAAVKQLERSRSNSPTGARAKALERLGRRPPGAPYKVGDSPPSKKK